MAKKVEKKKTKRTITSRELELKNHILGQETKYPEKYAPEALESFPNRHPSKIAWTTFVCTEFTSLCPKTRQPDFAKIFINYIADKTMVESKSLKLYLFSFRNHGDFHEDCIQKICNDLTALLKPHYLEVVGEFTPRGGIAIFPYASYSSKEAQFKKIKEKRFAEYAPGKYSMELSKLY
jgi:7-cyano-7-deazaguanine reductase